MNNLKLGFDPIPFVAGLVARGLVRFDKPPRKPALGMCGGMSTREYNRLAKQRWRADRRRRGLTI
jgi:hypothetical protein